MKFNGGQIVITNGIRNTMIMDSEFTKFINKSLERHFNGDWGDLCKDDKDLNDLALRNGNDRMLSRYKFNGEPIYIITEWDRSVTTILFPSEY